MRRFALALAALAVSSLPGALHAETTTIRVDRLPLTTRDFAAAPYQFSVVNSAGKQAGSCQWRMRWVVGGWPGPWYDLTNKTVCKLVFPHSGLMELQCRGGFGGLASDRRGTARQSEPFVCTRQFTIGDGPVEVERGDSAPAPDFPARSPGTLSLSDGSSTSRQPAAKDGTGTNTPFPAGAMVVVESPTVTAEGVLHAAKFDGWVFVLEAGKRVPSAISLAAGVRVRAVEASAEQETVAYWNAAHRILEEAYQAKDARAWWQKPWLSNEDAEWPLKWSAEQAIATATRLRELPLASVHRLAVEAVKGLAESIAAEAVYREYEASGADAVEALAKGLELPAFMRDAEHLAANVEACKRNAVRRARAAREKLGAGCGAGLPVFSMPRLDR